MASGFSCGGDLDLDAALGGGDAEVVAVGPVDQEGEVVLLGDVGRGRDQHAVDGEALDVHAEDLARLRDGVLRVLGQLHATGLAAAAGLDLGLDHDPAALRLGGCLGLLGRGDHGAHRDRDVVLGEELLRLVLHQIHVRPTPVRPVRRRAARISRTPRPPARCRTEASVRDVAHGIGPPAGVRSRTMTRVIYFTACTLDGFIADEHDSLDWLFEVPHGGATTAAGTPSSAGSVRWSPARRATAGC